MTSIGIEWETTALLRGDRSIRSKIPTTISEFIKITPEDWNHSGRKNRSVNDCVLNAEFQLGVFRHESSHKFNVSQLVTNCKLFGKIWEKDIENLKGRPFLTLNGKRYYILTVTNNPFEKSVFKDCALTKPGFWLTKNDKKRAYTNNLEYIKGNPQLTIGFKLKYLWKLFSITTEFIKICTSEKNKNKCIIKTVSDVKSAYIAGTSILEKSKFDVSDNLKSFYIYFVYHIYVYVRSMKPLKKGVYTKSLFLYKPRTNIRVIYDKLLTDKERIQCKDLGDFYYDYFTDIKEGDEKDAEFFVNTANIFIDTFYNKVSTGVFFKNNDNSDLPPLGIFKKNYKEKTNTESINYVNFRNKDIPSYIRNENNILSYPNDDSIYEFDVGEWTNDGPNIIFEIRGPTILYNLMVVAHDRPDKQIGGVSLSIHELCPVLRDLFGLLNKVIEK
jgi:hypothetical protein